MVLTGQKTVFQCFRTLARRLGGLQYAPSIQSTASWYVSVPSRGEWGFLPAHLIVTERITKMFPYPPKVTVDSYGWYSSYNFVKQSVSVPSRVEWGFLQYFILH